MKNYALVVHDEAQEETEEIKAWYEEQREGLGDRFPEALELAYKHIQNIRSIRSASAFIDMH